MRQWLEDDNIHLIGIEGIAGTGKSMLAAKIYEELEGFPKWFWADVSSGAIMFSDLARQVLTNFSCPILEEELKLINALVQCLRLGQYLLVIDNLESLLQSDNKWRSLFYEEFFRTWIEYGGGSKILVTTRQKPELEGFAWLSLKGLKQEEAASLLRELGIQGEVEAFAELVDGHPLLLKWVANLIKDEYPEDPNLERLQDLGLGNLREILADSGVVERHYRESVAMVLVLDVSFENLTDWQKIWLQNISVYRGTFDEEAVVAVFPQRDESWSLPVPREEVEQEFRQLIKRSFLEEKLCPQRRQFTFHPVVLEYVRYKAGEQAEVHRRVIDYYYSKAQEQPWLSIDDLEEYLEIFYHLCQLEEYAEAGEILSYCHDFLDLQGYYSAIVELNQQLVENWKPRNDEEKESLALALTRLGAACNSLGQFQKTIQYYQLSLDIDQELGNRNREGASLGNLGQAYNSLGQFQTAIDYYQRALEIARLIGDRSREGEVSNNLGQAYNSLGQFHRAIEYHQRALEIARLIGDRSREGASLGNLGLAYNSLEQFPRAMEYHQLALEIARLIGDRSREGASLGNLGRACNSLGQYERAIDYHQQALDLAKEIGDRQWEGRCLSNLGLAYSSLGQYERAIDYHQQALDLARLIGDRSKEVDSLLNLANAYHHCDRAEEGFAVEYQAQQILQKLRPPLEAMPYPKWLKLFIKYAQRGKLQLFLCFLCGLIAFPLFLVWMIFFWLWRLIEPRFRRRN